MIDIFLTQDFKTLLKNKNVVFLGDSNIRALYKDFLCLSRKNMFISQKTLKTKMEASCLGDSLIRHGPKSNGRCYREERKININGIRLSFYFLTQVFDNYVERILEEIAKESTAPDIFIINSCLWDVTRWGPQGVDSFKKNLVSIMKKLQRLFSNSLVIWITAPPIACNLKGGFLLKELEFLKYSLRFHVMEANQYARKVVVEHGFDVLDSHYHLKFQIQKRNDDGIHWVPSAVRYVANLLLTHISLALNVLLPHRYKSCEEDLESAVNSESQSEPAPEVPSAIPVGKENFIRRPRKNSRKKRKPELSHHAFIRNQNQMERQRRIRNWHTEAFNDTLSPRYFDGRYLQPYECRQYKFQNNDYFPQTPLQVSSPHNYIPPAEPMHYPSSRQFPLLPKPFPTYSVRYSPTMQHVGRQDAYSPIFQRGQPYRFPDININPQPRIDFSSNVIPFGIQF